MLCYSTYLRNIIFKSLKYVPTIFTHIHTWICGRALIIISVSRWLQLHFDVIQFLLPFLRKKTLFIYLFLLSSYYHCTRSTFVEETSSKQQKQHNKTQRFLHNILDKLFPIPFGNEDNQNSIL